MLVDANWKSGQGVCANYRAGRLGSRAPDIETGRALIWVAWQKIDFAGRSRLTMRSNQRARVDCSVKGRRPINEREGRRLKHQPSEVNLRPPSISGLFFLLEAPRGRAFTCRTAARALRPHNAASGPRKFSSPYQMRYAARALVSWRPAKWSPTLRTADRRYSISTRQASLA